jgi:hypothetical protein
MSKENKKKWLDKGEYWLSTAKQGSPEWKKQRMCRITGSRVGSFVGHSRFCGVEKSAKEITGILNISFSENSKALMSNGIRGEPHARKWLSEKLGKDITEVGLAVPDDFILGASVDGIIDKDTICEIKVPAKMYEPLIAHRNTKKKHPKYYHNHIWDSHYDQMQLGMFVVGAKWCHYVVYLPKADDLSEPLDVYHEVVPFNKGYWNFLYEHVKNNYEEHIEPIMKKYKIVRVDPPIREG